MKRKASLEDLEQEENRRVFLDRMEAAKIADAEFVRKGTESTPIPATPICYRCGEKKHHGHGCRCDKFGAGRVGWPEGRKHLPW